MNRLEVKTSKVHIVVVVLIWLCFVPLGLLLVINGSFGFGFAELGAFSVIFLLIRRAHRRTVKYFSEEGLVRNDGKSFAWADLQRVVNQVRIKPLTRKRLLWRTEIQFNNGDAAWLIPTKVSNYAEVGDFVLRLPCEQTDVSV